MPTSICPECDEEVYVDAEIEQGDQVTCEECSSGLVVVGLDPVELDLYDASDDRYLDDDDFDDDGFDEDRF
mgnify:CR=1 FL=1